MRRGPAPLPFVLAVFLLPGLLVCACGAPEPVAVFAAAPLAPALDEAGTAFTGSTGIPVTIRAGDPEALAGEIQDGAPADLFIPDSEEGMAPLLEMNLVDTRTRRVVGWNRVVLVVPNSALASSPSDFVYLNILETIAMANPETVSLGRVTAQALAEMGLWLPLQGRLVYAPSEGATLALVERREVQGGFVYASDAMASDKVKLSLEIPETTHDPVVYVGAVVTASPRHEQAFRFLNFLAGAEGNAVLRTYGLGGS